MPDSHFEERAEDIRRMVARIERARAAVLRLQEEKGRLERREAAALQAGWKAENELADVLLERAEPGDDRSPALVAGGWIYFAVDRPDPDGTPNVTLERLRFGWDTQFG